VADGVGSWRQYNVDPRLYSHRLVDNARKIIESDFAHRALIQHSPFESDLDPIHPLDVIMDAWNLTTSEEVPGSSTICVATLDKKLNQLSYSNIGDCGLIVIRHIDSETAGYMRERQKPRHLRKSDWRIAYLSQQQLRSFNLPYQLGFSNVPEVSNTNFESPSDADTASIPVMPGDVIVLATDGLFDNVDLDEIVAAVADWEERFFSGEENIYTRSARGNEAVQALAETLVKTARDVSLDPHRDSPFAILAKENDIMWGGGMPDDTTVIVARVVSMS
jgi:protein phosphatase PTC7